MSESATINCFWKGLNFDPLAFIWSDRHYKISTKFANCLGGLALLIHIRRRRRKNRILHQLVKEKRKEKEIIFSAINPPVPVLPTLLYSNVIRIGYFGSNWEEWSTDSCFGWRFLRESILLETLFLDFWCLHPLSFCGIQFRCILYCFFHHKQPSTSLSI